RRALANSLCLTHVCENGVGGSHAQEYRIAFRPMKSRLRRAEQDSGGECYRAQSHPATTSFAHGISKWRLLLPGASEPRLKLLRPQDFRSVFRTALRGQGHRSIVVVGNYEFGPISVVPCRAKARPLRPRRSYFAP